MDLDSEQHAEQAGTPAAKRVKVPCMCDINSTSADPVHIDAA